MLTVTVNFVGDIPDPPIEDRGENRDRRVCLSVCLCVCGGGGGGGGKQAHKQTEQQNQQLKIIKNIKPLPCTVYLQTCSWAHCRLSHPFYLTIS